MISIKKTDYQSILSDDCTDIGLVVNCAVAVKAGLCDSNQSGSATVRIYCQKSCNLCPSAVCNPNVNVCNNGTCQAATYFAQSSIQCACQSGFVGTYCNNRRYRYFF